jgi:hypothetical protein
MGIWLAFELTGAFLAREDMNDGNHITMLPQ